MLLDMGSPRKGRKDKPQLGRWQRTRRGLLQPIDIASLAFFRVSFGLILLWDVARHFVKGRIHAYYIEPTFHFPYMFFEWVKPWPGVGMYIHFGVLGLAALLLALGWLYRLAAVTLFVGFTYVFLLDMSLYLNHMYLVCLLCLLMCFLPAHKAFSIDARLSAHLASQYAPAWTLALLRFQIGVVYFFGGVAKLNPDWIRGMPLKRWLQSRSDMPFWGTLLAKEETAYFMAWGGLLFDLLVPFALLWKRTRLVAFAVAVMFHLTNAAIFTIGIFPWLAIAATTLFFPPAFPRRLVRAIASFGGPRIRAWVSNKGAPGPAPSIVAARRGAFWLLGVYVAVQILLPLRHFLYPGLVHWTEEGHKFAWHMKLRSKRGDTRFLVYDDKTGDVLRPQIIGRLTPRQWADMHGDPDMLLVLARTVAQELRTQGHADAQVHVFARASLNHRPMRMLIDPQVDLGAQPRGLARSPWILPFDHPDRPEEEAFGTPDDPFGYDPEMVAPMWRPTPIKQGNSG